MREAARKLMAEAFHVEPAAIDDDALLGQVPGWDSMGHLRLVLAIEEARGNELSPEDVVAIRSFADVVRQLGDLTRIAILGCHPGR